jgi:hypothetical protein
MVKKKINVADDAKRRIEIIDRNLYHLQEFRRGYRKRVIKVGLLVWAIGVLAFTVAAFARGSEFTLSVINVWLPLLIIALAAPVLVSASFIHKLDRREKTLRDRRKLLLSKFEREMLKEVKKFHKK